MPNSNNLGDTRANSIGGFLLPRFTSGFDRPLTTGRGVSVYYDRQPPNVWPEHSHEEVQIVIAIDSVDAVVSWKQNGVQERRGITGQFIWLMPAGVPHAAEWLGTGAMVVLYALPAFVHEVCCAEMRFTLVEDFSALARFDILVCELAEEFRLLCRRTTPATPAIIESAGTLLASKVLRYLVPQKRRYRLPAERLREVMDYLDAHISENVSRAELARIAGMSVRTFGDCFKERTGLTPFAYLMQRRTVRAITLVEEGILTKTSIAADLGFSDQSHMMRRIEAHRAAKVTAASRADQVPDGCSEDTANL